jgi:predicted phage terminase large subunit-like protein
MSVIPEGVEAERLRLELRLALLERREKSKSNFLDFARYAWPEAIFSAHHQKMADAFDRIISGDLKRLIINMPPRHRLALETPVATIDGWKTVGSVEVGDCVFAPDGSPVLVTGKSDVYEEDIYEVKTSDGQIIECDGEHLWTVRFGSGRPFETLSTVEILHKLETQAWRKDSNYPMLPPQSAAIFPYRSLPIDPYVLGVWLGDGSSSSSSIGCSFKDMDQMRQQIEACGYRTTHNPKFQQFNVLGLLPSLRALGVLGDKHIPEMYLCASIEQRMALLQGLIDTDGDVTVNGKVTFNQTDPVLTEQVLCLIHSLGVKARITTRQTSYNGVQSRVSHRIMFKLANAARLPRKASRCRSMLGNWSRSIDVRLTRKRASVCCLQVANDDGLFMAGRGWVVTHNTKSEFGSYLLPAYAMGRKPNLKIIQATHTGELAVRFGRKVRNLMDTQDYKDLFEGVELQADSKAAGRWDTNKGGEYFAVGVGGAMTGRGADLLIIDDPHSEQDALSALALDNAWEWYSSGPRSRLQPGGAVVVIMTRWGTKDLTARLIKSQNSFGSDKWEVIEFPAIFDEGTDRERPLWPSFWKLEELQAVRAQLGVQKWNAMYQQRPTADEGAILKREWWRIWEKSYMPSVEYIIQSYDTAYSKKETADYSVITTWGVFYPTEDSGPNLMLLDMRKGRWDFPDLKRVAKEQYAYWQPDNVLIEAKATGTTLQQELRRMGIPVTMYSPGGRRAGHDKVSRANAVAPMFESGMVWAPEAHWAQEVIEECASFPNGDNDDIVDSTTQALLRFRAGNFIALNTDEEDEVSDESVVPEYY